MNIIHNNPDSYFLNNDTLKHPSLTHEANLSKLTFKKKFVWNTALTLCAYSILKSQQKIPKRK